MKGTRSESLKRLIPRRSDSIWVNVASLIDAIMPRSGLSGPGDNVLDHLSLCFGVVLDIGPVPHRKLALRLGVELAVSLILAQTVAQQQVAFDLRRARRENVYVDILRRSPEHPVLVEVWLAHAQDVARLLQG